MQICNRAKILGLWVGVDNTDENCYIWNFKEPLEKIQHICDSWHHRHLSIKGKITVVNALMVSILQYPCSIVHTPERVFKEYKQMMWPLYGTARNPGSLTEL